MTAPYLKPVFIFSGVGTQWPGMGADLLESEPAFLEGVSAFDKAFSALSGTSPLETLRKGADMSASFRGHPCVLAIDLGLVALLRERSVKPAAIIGHSGGELAAAYAAGALTLEDTARVAWEHSRILEAVSGQGAMAHISLPASDLKPFLKDHAEMTVAAINSPHAVVISGPIESIKAVIEAVTAATGVFCRQLRIDSSLHTPAVEPYLKELEKSLSGLRPSAPAVPMYSSLHGRKVRPGDFDASYWCRHIRQPVLFAAAVESALSDGAEIFLEISPHAVLQDAIMDCARTSGHNIQIAPLMQRDEQAGPIIAEALSLLKPNSNSQSVHSRSSASSASSRILEADPDRRTALLVDLISEGLTEISEGLIEPTADQPFAAMGVTSILAVKLRHALCNKLALDLPAAIVYSYPTIAQLAQYINSQLTEGSQPSRTAPGRSVSNAAEPLAIVGFSCRLPGGVNNPESLWTLLKNGTDAVIKVPASRWDADEYYDPDPNTPGTSKTKEGGFLTCPIDQFDAPFFGISAREARQLDPQQRLLLELLWEAFERADIDITSLRNTRTGVFLGMSSFDYSHAHRDSYRRELIDAYSLTGTTFSGAAGRLAYIYDFRGPCFTVDTACSSSLVALHCACRSLREGESNTAVVGGVTLMMIPDLHVAFTKLGAVSADGRSKAFDDDADGYGRGEGGTMLVLKRLSDAERDGDRILALIRGTAINQDGKSNGLTAPNGLAQKEVIEDALANAQLAATDISYVEAHGTGTALGDSIEIQSLADAYCPNRSQDNPLMIGSIKANIGHLEAAAAVTGVAKIICSMQNRALPANIHIKTPNTRFDWARYPIMAPTEYTEWNPKDGVRRAGVSAFGFSGTNGHAILEEYIPKSASPNNANTPPAFVLPLSAKSPASLDALRKLHADKVAGLTDSELTSYCYTAATGRTHHGWRMAATGDNASQISEALKNAPLPEAPCESHRIAMVFTGQGSQYPNMGKELYESFPVFTAAINECAKILEVLDVDLLNLLYGGISADELAQTLNAQPLIASVEYALWKLWTSWGVKPEIVAGHSIGEYPAAVAAGVLTLKDMLTLVAARARAMSEAPPNGSMAAVFANEETVNAALKKHKGVVIAAVNAAESISISGVTDQVQAVCSELEKAGINSTILRVSHAFHSPLMAEAAETFKNALTGITFSKPTDAAFVSTVTGAAETDAFADPNYWVNQILKPVRFADAAATIAESPSVVLEAGGTAALSGLIRQSGNDDLIPISSLSPKAGAASTMAEAAARLYTAGVRLDGTGLYQPFDCRKIELPTYPFDSKSHWMEVHHEPPAGGGGENHPVLGRRLDSPALNDTVVFESIFDDRKPAFLHEHVIYGKPISPAAGHMAMLFAAIREIWGSPVSQLSNIEFLSPLVVLPETPRRVQLILESTKQEEPTFRLVSRAEASNRWTVHCTGTFSRTPESKPAIDPARLERDPTMHYLSRADFYHTFVTSGYEIGEQYKRIQEAYATDGDALCRVAVRQGHSCERGHVAYPGAIDSILQTGLPGFMHTYMDELLNDGSTLIPMHVEKVVLWGELPDNVICRAKSERVGDSVVSFNIMAMAPDGEPVMEMDGLLMRKTDRSTLFKALETDAGDLLYTQNWIPSPAPAANGSGELVVIASGSGKLASKIHELRGGVLLDAAALDELKSAAESGMRTVVLAHDTNGEKPTDDPTDSAVEAGMSFIETAGRLIRQDINMDLWVVTSGAAGPKTTSSSLVGSSLWGAAMSLAAEDPARAGGILDTDLSEPSIKMIAEIIGSPDNHPFGAVRDGEYHSLRLTRTTRKYEPPPVSADKTYLITGGSGALGLQLAEWLAGKGAGAIALVSRSGAGPDAVEKIEADAAGCQVEDLRYDIADHESVAALMQRIDASMPPLAGVFHAAGVLDDATIPEMSREKFTRVMLPKVRGAWLLHEATADKSLDWFVLFSSAAALLGSGGQSNYAAANMMLNELAALRHSAGLPAQAICWGPWGGEGMAAGSNRGERLAANGILELDPAKALDALEIAAGTGQPVVGAMAMDWEKFISTRVMLHGDYLAAFAGASSADNSDAGPAEASRLKLAIESAAPDQQERIEEELSLIAAQTLGFTDVTRVMTRQPLMEQGFDSLMAVEIRNRLMKDTGTKLPASFLFNHPTIEKIALWFVTNAAPEPESTEPAVTDLLDEIDELLK